MSAAIGILDWELEMTEVGHRNYTVTWLVQVDDPYGDGPAQAVTAGGLPLIGSGWIYGNDNDLWATCWPNFKARPVVTREANDLWTVETFFSTQPIKRCMDTQIENPIMEPFKVSGNFVNRTKQPKLDMNNNPITNSAQQLLSGPELEFDDNRPTIRIGWNRLLNPGPQATAFIDTVNDSPLWNWPARCVKLNSCSFTRNLWGVCNFYFTVEYEFGIMYDPQDTNPATGNVLGWDRLVPDRGNRVLTGYSPGYWEIAGRGTCPGGIPAQPDSNPNPINPATGLPWACGDLVQPGVLMDPLGIDSTTGNYNYKNVKNYEAYKMAQDGEPTETFLDGYGRPVSDIGQAKPIFVQYYPQSPMLSLGIPANIDINLFPSG